MKKKKEAPNYLSEVRKLVNTPRINSSIFPIVCPYNLNEKSRKQDFVAWKYAGVVWYLLDGKSFEESAKAVGLHRTVCYHAMKEVINSYSGLGNALIAQKIQILIDENKPSKFYSYHAAYKDKGGALEVSSLLLLQNNCNFESCNVH